MKKYIVGFIILVGIIAFILAQLSLSYAVSSYGSSGDEVKQIQQKLKSWGYYNGSIDGVYGSKTFEAVKKFQKKNGLTVDGVARFKNTCSTGNSIKFII